MRNLTNPLLAILFAAPLTIAAQQTTTIYAEDFSNEEAFARYTTLNMNEDEFTWEYDRERSALSCERYFDMAWDDLLLPPLNLVKGREYTFSFDVQVVGDDDFTDNFESITVYKKIKTNATSGFSEGELLGTEFEVIPESATPTRRTYTYVSEYNSTAYFTIEHNTCLEAFGEALRPYGKLIVDNISVTEYDPNAPVNPDIVPAKPLAVETPSLTYDYTNATATLTWKPVTEDENGNALTAADVTYTVRRRGDSAPLATGLTTCSFTDAVTFDDVNATVSFGQKRLQYYVTASNAQGDSPSTLSQIRSLGQPDGLPFIESFANGGYSHFWTENHTGHGRWTAMDASDRYTQDADGGLYTFSAQDNGESGTAYSALVDMEGAIKPVLTFYVYYVFPSGDLNLLVSADGGAYRQAWAFDPDRDAANEWVKVEVPLADCNAAHTLQFAFDASELAVASLVYIDNLSLQSSLAHDLDISIASMPRNLTVGENRTMKVKVTNRGTQNVSGDDYDVQALAYGWPIASASGVDVEAGKSVVITLSGLKADGHFDTSVTLAARVDYINDEYHNNDYTPVATLPVKHSLYPAPNNVEAEVTSAGVVLTWSAPDAPRSVSTPLTDSFEDYEDFTITNAGEWTFYQGVEGNVYSLEGIAFPNAGHPQAWMVFNPSEAGITNRPAHSGEKYLAAFSHPYVTEDSWFISERLGGISQQISLWARAFDTYTETFKVSYSTEDMEPESFVDLGNSTTTVTQEWTKYTFDLPEGTKYFAVRATSTDALALLVDDVTYVPATQAAQNIKLVGYNIYRDGDLVATCPADALTWTDTPEPEYHTYRIAALWDKGESALTPHLDVDLRNIVGLQHMVNAADAANQPLYDAAGRRVAQSFRGIVVNSAGRKLLK